MEDTMSMQHYSIPAHPAIVAKGGSIGAEAAGYLTMDASGRPIWVTDPALATAFPSMRDATRAALRLPSSDRAYGLPLDVEFGAMRAAA